MTSKRSWSWWVWGSLKHKVRTTWFSVNLLVWLAVFHFEGLPILGTQLTAEQFLGLFLLGFTLCISMVTHKLDRKYGGGGLANRFDRLHKDKYDRRSSSASMAVTKQSVFVAISLGLIAFITSQREPLASTDFAILVLNFELAALGTSLFLALVSILCYDYSHRFCWGDHFKEDLLRRALFLDTLSWYSLATGLALCLGNIHPLALMLASLLFGTLLVYYYFPTDYYSMRDEIVSAFEKLNLDQYDLKLKSVTEDSSWRTQRPSPQFSIPYNTKWAIVLVDSSGKPRETLDLGPLHDLASRKELELLAKRQFETLQKPSAE